MKTKVINIKSGDPYDIYIGRPSKWGNPFIIGRDGTREEVVQKYREWITTIGKDRLKDLYELEGQILGCFCAPLSCHGDVLIELIKDHISADHDVLLFLDDNAKMNTQYPDSIV